MRILLVHNTYKIRGGEDESRDAEEKLLRHYGHTVHPVLFENDEINSFNAALTGLQAVWRQDSYNRILDEIRLHRPDLISVHNFFPIASPSIYYAARKCGVPVVQTLHNYRLLCPSAIFFRDGHTCEDCLGKSLPWPSVLHGCYRGSRPATAAVASMVAIHNLLGTWKDLPAAYIALSEFSRRKFIEGGLPADRLVVKPNFLEDPGPGDGSGDYVICVGRLTLEKGLKNLIEAWRMAQPPGRLLIAGEGPLRSFIADQSSRGDRIEYLGRIPLAEVQKLLASARALVFPSIWYEGMPRVILESFSRGTPVIASRIGSMPEMIEDNRTGWLTGPGNIAELAAAILKPFDIGTRTGEIRFAARAEYLAKYTPEQNYRLLNSVYSSAISGSAEFAV